MFSDQNPRFSSKSTVFVKICGFRQNLRFSSKSAFLSELSRGQHQQQIGILCETKDHLPRKVTLIFIYRLIRDLCQIFLLAKRCSMPFCVVYPKRSNVDFLYSFIHVFIHNSITKYYWQILQTFGKGF